MSNVDQGNKLIGDLNFQQPISIIDVMFDKRVNCYSCLTVINLRDYLNLIHKPLDNKGAIQGQREGLKTTTALRIRKRLVEDLRAGAVIPPVVLGIRSDDKIFKDGTISSKVDSKVLLEIIKRSDLNDLSIIDGMQRSTAVFEAQDEMNLDQSTIRVEFWIAPSTQSLIYRMLILNTGQVPWTMRRQIEVVYDSLIKEIEENVDEIVVLKIDEKGRRKKGGYFQGNDIIELYLAFGLRKEVIDLKERLADEFTRLDFLEGTGEQDLNKIFFQCLKLLVSFDKIFVNAAVCESSPFKNGIELFSSSTALTGFITALAHYIYGRPGISRNKHEIDQRVLAVEKMSKELIQKISKYNPEQLRIFLDFDTLNELIMDIRATSSKIGIAERQFFLSAFKILIEEKFSVERLTPCWRSASI